VEGMRRSPTGKKQRKTFSRNQRLKERREKAKEANDWRESQAIAQMSAQTYGGRSGTSGGHGVTLELRKLPHGPIVELFHDSHKKGTYVNPARDLRKGRKLRARQVD
jgi:hypothetical protein